MVAEGWGLTDFSAVSCSLVQNVSPLKSVNIALNEEDYQMAECSAERIQTTLLDQVGIVGRYQSIVIWLSASISVKAVVGKRKIFTSRILRFRDAQDSKIKCQHLHCSIFRYFKSIF